MICIYIFDIKKMNTYLVGSYLSHFIVNDNIHKHIRNRSIWYDTWNKGQSFEIAIKFEIESM
jgi:hypothetical protein